MLKFIKCCVFAISLMLTATVSAQMGGGMGGAGIDLAAIAETLGVSEEALVEAMGEDRPPNFSTVAENLGLTEEEVVAAFPQRGQGGGMGGAMAPAE